MAEAINSTTKKRHDGIFQEYINVLKEHGAEARNLSKKSMYLEVARRTGYSFTRVSHVIASKFKES